MRVGLRLLNIKYAILVDYIHLILHLLLIKKSITRVDITAHPKCFPEAFCLFEMYVVMLKILMNYSCKLFYFLLFILGQL